MDYCLPCIAADMDASVDSDDITEDGMVADDVTHQDTVEDDPCIVKCIRPLGKDLPEQHDPVVEAHSKNVERSVFSCPGWVHGNQVVPVHCDSPIEDYCKPPSDSGNDGNIDAYEPMIELFRAADRLVDIMNVRDYTNGKQLKVLVY